MQRGSYRTRWFSWGVAVAVAALAAVLSCLPDLDVAPDAGVPRVGFCGDGYIDSDAGEQCDPGVVDASVPGCTKRCQIECASEAGLQYIDHSSNHCYFLLSTSRAPLVGTACDTERAHVVTLGNGSEASNVDRAFLDLPQALDASGTEFWLGARGDDTDGGIYHTVVDEPGFPVPKTPCSGCYVNGSTSAPVPLPSDAGNQTCLTWSVVIQKWYVTACDAGFPTICEREPVGSRRYACGGLECFDTQLDFATQTHTTYVWIPGASLSADDAETYCENLGGAQGTGSLVIFNSDEQREQVFYELMHLPTPLDGGPPTEFWIGLTSSAVGDAGRITWKWANLNEVVNQWGDQEPRAALPGVRAYASQSSLSYAVPGATYDTQLIHAHDPPDGGVERRAVLCQIQAPP